MAPMYSNSLMDYECDAVDCIHHYPYALLDNKYARHAPGWTKLMHGDNSSVLHPSHVRHGTIGHPQDPDSEPALRRRDSGADFSDNLGMIICIVAIVVLVGILFCFYVWCLGPVYFRDLRRGRKGGRKPRAPVQPDPLSGFYRRHPELCPDAQQPDQGQGQGQGANQPAAQGPARQGGQGPNEMDAPQDAENVNRIDDGDLNRWLDWVSSNVRTGRRNRGWTVWVGWCGYWVSVCYPVVGSIQASVHWDRSWSRPREARGSSP